MPRYLSPQFSLLTAISLSLCLATNVQSQTPQGAPSEIVLRAITARGTKALKESDVRAAAEKAAAGKPTVDAARRAAVDATLELYRKHGYTMAQVTDAELTDDGTLSLQIAEGVIRRVLVRGNRKTKERTIRHALSIRPGDVYQESRINEERKRLARLGIFADLSIAPRVPGATDETPPEKTDADQAPADKAAIAPDKKPANAADRDAPLEKVSNIPNAPGAATETLPPDDAEIGSVDLSVNVKEADTASVQASLGYSEGVGTVGFVDLSEGNLFGTGQQAQVLWQRTVQVNFRSDGTIDSRDARSAFALAYGSPALNRQDLAFGLQIYDSNTVYLPLFGGVRETLRTYEKRRGARARIGRELTPEITAFLTARRDEIGYDGVPSDLLPSASELARSSGTVGALGVSLISDGRDSLDFPTNGYRVSAQYENSARLFGGDLPFSQVEGDWRQYIALGRRPRQKSVGQEIAVPTLAGRLVGGTSWGNTPLQERFYLGGYELLRGYDLFAFSGQNVLLATAELRFPLSVGLQAVAFSDYGGAWKPAPRQMRGSVGAGLRFATPIGPIRLDAAYGSRLQTYISLGQNF